MHRLVWPVLVALLTLPAGRACGASFTYSYLSDPLVGPDGATALFDINNQGEILGFSRGQTFDTWSFIYSNGAFSYFYGLPGFSHLGYLAFNDGGQIVAQGYDDQGSFVSVVLQGGAVQQVIAFPGAIDTLAFGINNAGMVVGWYFLNGEDHAFSYSAGVYRDLGLGPDSLAYDVNNNGDIVGVFECRGHVAPVHIQRWIAHGRRYSGGQHVSWDQRCP